MSLEAINGKQECDLSEGMYIHVHVVSKQPYKNLVQSSPDNWYAISVIQSGDVITSEVSIFPFTLTLKKEMA